MVKAIQEQNKPAVVFMGYCGDDVWGSKGKIDSETGDLLSTPPISGSNLAEIRLLSGFVTITPAYLFIKDVAQLKKISSSKEMEPWKLNNDYDRPIPRRVAEESGVPREWFGMKKRHITTTYFLPMNRVIRRKFFSYLKSNLNIGKWYVMAYLVQKRILVILPGIKIFFCSHIDFYDLMRKWATSVLVKEYSVMLKESLRAMERIGTDSSQASKRAGKGVASNRPF